MPLLSLRNIAVSFGGPLLLDNINLRIDSGERLCLLGRNGAGKSSLLKLIAGKYTADDGEYVKRQNLRITMLEQEVPRDLDGSVYEIVAAALAETGQYLIEFQQVVEEMATNDDEKLLTRMADLQHKLDQCDGWQMDQRIAETLSRCSLEPHVRFSSLSGGLKRRVLCARALVSDPDLLLLDEPTNHLDIAGIQWLGDFLLSFKGTLLFITHDRAFLQRMATRIIEIDRGQLTSWPGNYQAYLKHKQEALDNEATLQAKFDKKLSQEEVWIRQGIKARRTRDEGRVRRLLTMRHERMERRSKTGVSKIKLQDAERSGKLVSELEDISFSYDDGTISKPIIRQFSTTIIRGDRIGIIGPNGAGKTTLIKLLLGELTPDSGKIKLGSKLEVLYFDQLRSQLDETKTVEENVADGNTFITAPDGTSKHVISYLQDFLFPPERARTPVKALSGGERNRLMMAKLFTKAANVLVMDEPTNDLDIETLELLEELLLNFKGTVIVVSHDRAFLNNVITSTMVITDNGNVAEYVGNYDDYLRQKPSADTSTDNRGAKKSKSKNPVTSAKKTDKLNYKEQHELEQLPQTIDALESEQETLNQKMADPDFYKADEDLIITTKNRVTEIVALLETAYKRWQQLDS